MQPYRSALYVPASNARAMEKARGLAADAILFDLEDAVSSDAKPAARAALAEALGGDFGHRQRIIRINGLETDWGAEDARAAAQSAPDGVLLPKVDGPAQLEALAGITGELPLWAMIETPLGVLNAPAIAAHPRLAGLVFGGNDLAKDLRARDVPGRAPLLGALQAVLLAARAHGKVALDGVFNAFRDAEGFAEEARQGRDFGFDGKTLIHPAQIAPANEIFAPDAAQIAEARRIVAAFEAAMAEGQGVAVLEGRIIESLHVETARATLAQAEVIAALEAT